MYDLFVFCLVTHLSYLCMFELISWVVKQRPRTPTSCQHLCALTHSGTSHLPAQSFVDVIRNGNEHATSKRESPVLDAAELAESFAETIPGLCDSEAEMILLFSCRGTQLRLGTSQAAQSARTCCGTDSASGLFGLPLLKQEHAIHMMHTWPQQCCRVRIH